jgi:hypothetical protein
VRKASNNLKRVQSLELRRRISNMIVVGKRRTEIAAELGITLRCLEQNVVKILATESMFPSSLGPEEVGRLRQIEAEILAKSRSRALYVQSTIAARVGTKEEKGGDGLASARLMESITRAVELESDLFGTKQPTRVIEEQMRLQVNLTRSGDRPVLTWDRSILDKPVAPVPGLTMYEGCRSPAALEAPPNVNGATQERVLGSSEGHDSGVAA